MAQHVLVGNSAPTEAPRGIGNHYIDRVNKAIYLSVGTDSVADWLQVATSLVNDSRWKKIAVAVTPEIISRSYFDLPHLAQPNTLEISIGQLNWFEGFAYTLGIVNNKTRVNIIGEIAPGGESALEAGEIIHVSYKSY